MPAKGRRGKPRPSGASASCRAFSDPSGTSCPRFFSQFLCILHSVDIGVAKADQRRDNFHARDVGLGRKRIQARQRRATNALQRAAKMAKRKRNSANPGTAAVKLKGIGIGARRNVLHDPCHTTRHAGPHRAVRRVEVTRRAGAPPVRRRARSAARCGDPMRSHATTVGRCLNLAGGVVAHPASTQLAIDGRASLPVLELQRP